MNCRKSPKELDLHSRGILVRFCQDNIYYLLGHYGKDRHVERVERFDEPSDLSHDAPCPKCVAVLQIEFVPRFRVCQRLLQYRGQLSQSPFVDCRSWEIRFLFRLRLPASRNVLHEIP